MLCVVLKRVHGFDRKIRRFTDKRKLYLHIAYEKGLYHQSMRFLTSCMKRHYWILLHKRYVEGLFMTYLYEAQLKCWVPSSLREMPVLQDLTEKQNPKLTLAEAADTCTCTLKPGLYVPPL